MSKQRFLPFLALPALLSLSGCGYVHIGRLPEATATAVGSGQGDDKVVRENADLRTEKKMLQQELALSRAQGEALRSALEGRAADGETSKKLVEKLNETTRELAALRANYSRLQTERSQGLAPDDAKALQGRLGEAEEKLAGSLRAYTELQEEISKLRGEVARTQAENVTLSQQVKVATAENQQAQAALAQLNKDLLAQSEARTRAEEDVAILSTELKSVAPNSTVLSQLRAGPAGQTRSLAAEQAAENISLRQQLDSLKIKVTALETERSQLQEQLTKIDLPNLVAKISSVEREAGQLRQENAQLKAVSGSAQTLQDQLKLITAQALALTEENNKLKSRLSAARPVAAAPDLPKIDVNDAAATPAPKPAPAATKPGTGSAEPAVIAVKTEASSVSATLVAPGSGRAAAGGRTHVVAGGDTLAKISSQYYGTPSRWADILAANRDTLGENNNLVVGRTLRIP